jgi:hypothetical protein
MYAASAATPRSGLGGAATFGPPPSSSAMTPAQLELSAQAPWTKTMVGELCAVGVDGAMATPRLEATTDERDRYAAPARAAPAPATRPSAERRDRCLPRTPGDVASGYSFMAFPFLQVWLRQAHARDLGACGSPCRRCPGPDSRDGGEAVDDPERAHRPSRRDLPSSTSVPAASPSFGTVHRVPQRGLPRTVRMTRLRAGRWEDGTRSIDA